MVAMCGSFSSFIMPSRRLRQAYQNQSLERVTQNANRWYLNSGELPYRDVLTCEGEQGFFPSQTIPHRSQIMFSFSRWRVVEVSLPGRLTTERSICRQI